MAYTKAPVSDTHNVIRLPPTGEAFVVSKAQVQPTTVNYLDCFPLTEKQWNGEPRRTVQKREGWTRAVASGTVTSSGTLGTALIAAPDVASYPNVFFTKGSGFYMFNYSTKAVSSVTTSTIAGAAAGASGTNCVDSTNAKRIAMLSGTYELKTWLQDGTSVTTTDLTALALDGTKGLVFLNSYLFAVNGIGYSIYNSTVGGNLTTWAATDFLSAEQEPDPILYIDKHKNYLVAFGSESIEFFYDGGVEVGSPLVRQETYSTKIGIYTEGAGTDKKTCRDGDDIYFLGSKGNDTVNLYRIRNFKVEEIQNAWLQNAINYSTTDPKTSVTYGIETLVVNNSLMIQINMTDLAAGLGYAIMYFPKEDAWWMHRQGSPTGTDYPYPEFKLGDSWFSQRTGFVMFLGQVSAASSVVSYWIPDQAHVVSVVSDIYTPVTDFGINYYKHFARVDVVGDFGSAGANTVTLSYNPTPVYDTTYTACTPTRTVSTTNMAESLSWYNLGGWRRGSFKVTITGTSHAVYEGLDIEYNSGAA